MWELDATLAIMASFMVAFCAAVIRAARDPAARPIHWQRVGAFNEALQGLGQQAATESTLPALGSNSNTGQVLPDLDTAWELAAASMSESDDSDDMDVDHNFGDSSAAPAVRQLDMVLQGAKALGIRSYGHVPHRLPELSGDTWPAVPLDIISWTDGFMGEDGEDGEEAYGNFDKVVDHGVGNDCVRSCRCALSTPRALTKMTGRPSSMPSCCRRRRARADTCSLTRSWISPVSASRTQTSPR